MQKLVLNQPPTLNEMLNKARANKFKAASDKKTYTNRACRQAKLQLTPFVDVDRLWIIPEFNYITTASDPDNLFACLKYVMDGLVKAEIIANDTVKVITSPVICKYSRIKRGETKKLTLTIYDDLLEWQRDAVNIINNTN